MEEQKPSSYTMAEAMEQYTKAHGLLREIDMPKRPPRTPRHIFPSKLRSCRPSMRTEKI